MKKDDFYIGREVGLIIHPEGLPEVVQGTVKKVGSKYITVEHNLTEYKFSIRENFADAGGWKAAELFLTAEDARKELERKSMLDKIQRFFGAIRGGEGLRYEDVKKIYDIINGPACC